MSETGLPTRSWSILKRSALHVLFWFLCLTYLETLLHLVIFKTVTGRFFYILGFTAVIAGLMSAATSLLSRRCNANVTTVLLSFLCVLYASQIIYYYIFGGMYALSMVALGGNAITNFWKEMFSSIMDHLPVILLSLVPIPCLCLTRKFAGQLFEQNRNRSRLYLLMGAVALQILMLLCLRLGGTGFFTAYSYYHSDDATTDQSAENFGLLTTFRLEFQHILTGSSSANYYAIDDDSDVQSNPQYGRQILDIDFDALSQTTTDPQLQNLNAYCGSLSGTQKNKYTGMLKDYNLIVLCAESFSTAAIDEELTPTLWKLSHEGFIFNNYYNTFPNTTTDGEYALCQGLLPDKTRGKRDSSFYASRNSYLPMCLGNIFQEQRGITSYGYHNYSGDYYGRYLSHPNMGYQMKFAGMGMQFTTGWPTSDLEMMEQSIPDYLGQDQFHAYYMTFSGHYKYDPWNPMAARNYDAVRDLNFSEPVKCYLSCNLELEKAMAYLMEQLEKAGVADRTAIVLAGDHFPYGLTNAEYDELIGHKTDFFETYKDTLIFWVGGLEEPIEVNEYCCNTDVLPTILNLWGFDYDSRLLAGTDVFSSGTHIAILADQSFLTDKVWFNASTNTATWQVDESTVSPSYLDNMIRLVKNRFSISADILNKAYYNFVFGKQAVSVSTDAWISEEDWNGTGSQDDDTTVTTPEGSLPPADDPTTLPPGSVVPPDQDPNLPIEDTPDLPPDSQPDPPQETAPDPQPNAPTTQDPQTPPDQEPQTGTTVPTGPELG